MMHLEKTQSGKIAIVYLLFYHNESYVDDMVSAIKHMTYDKSKVELVVVVNPHPKLGPFVRYIEETVMPLSGKDLPHVTMLVQKENTGFAKGNNIGMKWAIDHGFEYAYLHNNDGFIASNAFEPLIDVLKKDDSIAIAQSLIMLHPETLLVNSTGNAFHFLGFGYCKEYRSRLTDIDVKSVEEIAYASGAALMIRLSLVEQLGGLDEDYWLYHEDLELSFRMRLIGKRIVMVKDSVFYHKYQFARSVSKLYWMERNRFGTMLIYFKWPTLLLLLPLALPVELGLIVFSLKGGWFPERMKAYKYWLSAKNWKLWLKKRKRLQKIRTISDRQLFEHAVTGIAFQDKMVDKVIIHRLANPVMKLYYFVVVKGLIWW